MWGLLLEHESLKDKGRLSYDVSSLTSFFKKNLCMFYFLKI